MAQYTRGILETTKVIYRIIRVAEQCIENDIIHKVVDPMFFTKRSGRRLHGLKNNVRKAVNMHLVYEIQFDSFVLDEKSGNEELQESAKPINRITFGYH